MEPTLELPELKVNHTPLVVTSNFPALRTWLNSELKKYEIEVTAETLPDAKRAMTELSALAKKLNQARIDYAKEFKKPITAWEEEAKTLFDSTTAAREKIATQTKKFDDETRALCNGLMTAFLGEEYERLEVRPDYQKGFEQIAALVGISHVTKTKALAKSGRDSIEGLAQNGRMAQEKSDGRMARVEADCRAAGVEPLTREHVASFLDADDKTFSAKKESMIKAEVARLEAQKKKIRDEEEAKARAKVEAEEAARKQKEAADAKIKADADRGEKEKIDAERAAKEKANKELADKMEADRKKAVDELAKLQAENRAKAATPEPNPAAVDVVKPVEDATDKAALTFKYNIMVSVLAKVGADPARVGMFIGEMVAKAAAKADSRIIHAEVVE